MCVPGTPRPRRPTRSLLRISIVSVHGAPAVYTRATGRATNAPSAASTRYRIRLIVLSLLDPEGAARSCAGRAGPSSLDAQSGCEIAPRRRAAGASPEHEPHREQRGEHGEDERVRHGIGWPHRGGLAA